MPVADALSHLRAGDTPVVWKLDRLGRTVRQLVDFTAQLRMKEINFVSLTDGNDTGTAAGRFFFHVMAGGYGVVGRQCILEAVVKLESPPAGANLEIAGLRS